MWLWSICACLRQTATMNENSLAREFNLDLDLEYAAFDYLLIILDLVLQG